MALLDFLTGGKSGDAEAAQKAALAALQNVQTPTAESLTLPELQQYAAAMNMTPAQMQAFLQQSNAFNNQNIDQTGTSAQKQALSQLADVANAGPEGTATSRAQVEQINQDQARNLAGQRGAIDQQAQARGVPPGLLQAALAQTQAGQGAQDAHMAALGAQSNAYQQALNAMAQGGALGGQLQGQQNSQANTVAQAQNAMQQFNAANQQAASATNAGYQQQANATNTQNANDTSRANTGLANQRTQYNAQVPQTVFQDQFQKASGIANQNNNLANTYTNQGQQSAGIFSGLLGAGATLAGGPAGGAAAGMLGSGAGSNSKSIPAANNPSSYIQDAWSPSSYTGYSSGGEVDFSGPDVQFEDSVPGPDYAPDIYNGNDGRIHLGESYLASQGGMMPQDETCMKSGGPVPGQAQVPGDSPKNDTVHARLSPGEFVVPRSVVQNHPEDIATLLAAMKHMRGAK